MNRNDGTETLRIMAKAYQDLADQLDREADKIEKDKTRIYGGEGEKEAAQQTNQSPEPVKNNNMREELRKEARSRQRLKKIIYEFPRL